MGRPEKQAGVGRGDPSQLAGPTAQRPLAIALPWEMGPTGQGAKGPWGRFLSEIAARFSAAASASLARARGVALRPGVTAAPLATAGCSGSWSQPAELEAACKPERPRGCST